ncbi:MAG: ureidoglycolate lyase [Gaiellaceae bacterium]
MTGARADEPGRQEEGTMTMHATVPRELSLVDATPETVGPFGRLVGVEVRPDIDIPYYPGRVVEGGDIGFRYRGQAALRTAQVLPGGQPEVSWLERHMYLTQLFVAISGGAYVMVLAPPNHDADGQLPDLDAAVALRLPPGSVLLLHSGTWHDFPIAVDQPVTFLLANSAEVVEALRTAGRPRELNEGDVQKVSLPDRLGVTLRPLL